MNIEGRYVVKTQEFTIYITDDLDKAFKFINEQDEPMMYQIYDAERREYIY